MSTDETPTPVPDTSRQTGSRSVADGAIRDCTRMAEQLEARSLVIAAKSGRPDFAMQRTAFRLRSLAKLFAAWAVERTNPGDRQRDRDMLLVWYREGGDLLKAHPADVKSEPPP